MRARGRRSKARGPAAGATWIFRWLAAPPRGPRGYSWGCRCVPGGIFRRSERGSRRRGGGLNRGTQVWRYLRLRALRDGRRLLKLRARGQSRWVATPRLERVATRIGNHVGRAGASRAVCIAIPTRARRVLFALAHRAETRPTCALAPGITTAALRVAATATTTVEPAAQTCALAETLAGAATAAAGDDAAWSSDEVSS